MKTLFALIAGFATFFLTPNKGETTYVVDVQNSKLAWTAKKVTGSHTGLVPVSSGSLSWANNKLKGGSFEIDVKNLTVTDLTDASYNAKLVGHLKGEDFFAVDKFPKANLVITSATPKGSDSYDLVGKLTIKGISNEVRFPATIKTEKGKLSAQATIAVDRTKYDIKYRSKNFFENLGDKAIDNDFELNVTLVAIVSDSPKSKIGK
ncbi:MAG: YceI family protein [Spirosomataceae bacterium]|mgnify:CR=1 FL=1